MNLRLMRDLEVPCCNNGGANSRAVADHAVLLMLAVYKQLMAAERSTREGRWSQPIDRAQHIRDGGQAGRHFRSWQHWEDSVARRVQGFESRVQYYDLFPLPPEIENELGVTRVGIEELFETSDIISVHTPLTPGTRHIVSRELIGLMKPTAILVNTSRGPVVDESALIDALRDGKIAAAGLDVFEKEPVDNGQPAPVHGQRRRYPSLCGHDMGHVVQES